MKKWSYQICLGIMIACCVLFTPAIGQEDCYDPCYFNDCSCGDYSVDVGFLWWKPCVDRLDFAHCVDFSSLFEESPIVRVKHRTICPDWEPGVRIQAMAHNLNCGMGLGVSWTYIGPKKSSSVDGDRICMSIEPFTFERLLSLNEEGSKFCFSPWTHLGVLPFEKIHASWESSYHDWDVLLYYPCCVCENSQTWTPYFGFASLVLNQKVKEIAEVEIICEESFTIDRELKMKWASDLKAYGLRVGMKYEWDFCECFKIFGKFDASVLAGSPCDKLTHDLILCKEFDGESPDKFFEAEAIFKDDNCYRCYPGYRLGAGVSYDKCCCGTDLTFRIGYEFVEWHNIPNQRLPLETVDPVIAAVFDSEGFTEEVALGVSLPSLNTTSPSDRTLGFHGLVLEVSACF